MTLVIFSRRHNIGSLYLRTAMWSPWSHCGVIDVEKGEVIQAIFPGGVVATPLEQFIEHSSFWAVVEFPANAADSAKAARKLIGTDYDVFGVVGIGLHREWQDESKLFCSELVAIALEKGGLVVFRQKAWRITPMHLWMLDYPIVADATTSPSGVFFETMATQEVAEGRPPTDQRKMP